MELHAAESHLVQDGNYYVKCDWTTAEKSRKKVTDKWVREYRRGLDGDIVDTTRLSVAINHYLGLCKVSIPIVTDNQNETADSDCACDCDLYNLYLTCPHSIFVRVKTGVLDAKNITAPMGRVRPVGRTRKNRGPYSKNDEEPLPKRRRK